MGSTPFCPQNELSVQPLPSAQTETGAAKVEAAPNHALLGQAAEQWRSGNIFKARQLAMHSALIAPHSEIAWLILAAVVPPQASLHLLKQALVVNPQSQRARKGVEWALKRMGAVTGGPKGKALDNQVIIVSAYYDGLGVGPDGTFYLGANDNVSGVAVMLELARVLKQGGYAPDKTLVFTARTEGERSRSLSVKEIMSAHTTFDQLAIEAVIELSGMDSCTGKVIYLDEGSSFRLVSLFQDAASRQGTNITTRGKGPHHDHTAADAYGGRSALSAYVSWDGSDQFAHTTQDTFETIDPEKLRKSGQTTLLVLSVLSRETEY